MRLKRSAKGWTAEAGADVAAGQFVCLYVGEQLSTKQASQRLQHYDSVPGGANHALLVRLPSQATALPLCHCLFRTDLYL